MKNSVYVRKSEISNEKLREFVKKIVDEKDELERDFNDYFSSRFILVKYQDEEMYYDKDTFLIFPIFDRCTFENYSLDEKSYEEILIKFKEDFGDFNWELLTENDLKKCFYRENKANIVKDGKIVAKDGELNSYIVVKDDKLYCYNENMEKTEKGFAIPLLRLEEEGKELEEMLEIWEKKKITPLFSKKRQEERYQELLEIYTTLKRYSITGKKMEIDEVFRDLEEEKFSYPIDDYKEKLLRIEKERIDTDLYDVGIFLDSERGHWDIFYNEDRKDIKDRKVVKIITNEKLYPRNPKKDIRDSGVVAIDFGTKSTVVACQRDNDRSYLVKVGGGSYLDYEELKKYENPTVMEFIDIERFLYEYNLIDGRPFTKWEDLRISHTAVSDFLGGSTSVVDGLKQWCGNKNETFIIYDKKGKKIELAPYLEGDKNIVDPIEIYAYYIGSYINNMYTGDIFLEYLLSFPITYEKEIREKMLKSFEKGIKKSLPLSVLDDEELMSEFVVRNGTNEPTAYALCALNEFDLIPKDVGEKLYYAVFDFGGGTTDFTFGICTKSESRRYDYEIRHFGENGDKYLGGENILRFLSYEIYKENIKKMISEKIPIFCPEGCNSKFLGSENVVMNSYEAKYNMKQISEKIRWIWEEEKDSNNEKLKLSLLRKDGSRAETLELDYDRDRLDEIIKNMIDEGINNFYNALTLIFKNNTLMDDIENMTIFLAGNSSKNSIFQEAFKKKLESFEREFKNGKIFNLYLPLGSENNLKNQKNSNKNFLNGKTGTAFGLLEARAGGRVKIIAVDEIKNNSEVNFNYYLGYSSNGKLQILLNYKTGYGKWVEFLEADARTTYIYYTDKQSSIEKNLSSSDESVKKRKIVLEDEYEGAYIYLRIKDVDTIEYVVATREKMKKGEYFGDIKTIKL